MLEKTAKNPSLLKVLYPLVEITKKNFIYILNSFLIVYF